MHKTGKTQMCQFWKPAPGVWQPSGLRQMGLAFLGLHVLFLTFCTVSHTRWSHLAAFVVWQVFCRTLCRNEPVPFVGCRKPVSGTGSASLGIESWLNVAHLAQTPKFASSCKTREPTSIHLPTATFKALRTSTELPLSWKTQNLRRMSC